jgi:predicted Zn-dependent peptidase
VAPNLIVSAAGNIQHAQVRDIIAAAFGRLPSAGGTYDDSEPHVFPQVIVRSKELEQSHVCLGTNSYPQHHQDRYVSYILNTLLGGSMSSRLFQNVREKRGLAYAVFSGLSAYRDAGNITIYAGCANEAVPEVVHLCVEELRAMKQAPVPEAELRRAKDHLKGSLMLSLENTASRMSHLARQEIYFERHFGLDETLAGVERVSSADLTRVAQDLFANGSLAATIVGPSPKEMTRAQLDLA